jgi:hypothetical protein
VTAKKAATKKAAAPAAKKPARKKAPLLNASISPPGAKRPVLPKKLEPLAVTQKIIGVYDIESICAKIRAGDSMIKIAREVGRDHSSLIEFLRSRPDWRAAVDEARAYAAHAYVDLAEQVIADLPKNAGPAELFRARELAHHYRWKAKTLGRYIYGDHAKPAAPTDADPLSTLVRAIQQRGSRLPVQGLGAAQPITDVEPVR